MPAYKHQIKCAGCNKVYTAEKRSRLTLCPDCLIIHNKRREKQRAEERKLKKLREEEQKTREIEREKLEKKKEIERRQRENAFTVPKLGYRFELFKLNSKSLPLFASPQNRRRISPYQVSSLCKILYNGRHFDSPIVVNKVRNLLRVVDGNHRIEAFKRVLKKHPRFNMEILLITYSNLDNDGEIEAFGRWNVGKVQSTDDFIQSIAHKVDFIKWLKRDFPVTITVYKNPYTLSVRLLCGALLAAMNDDDTGYGLERNRFYEDLLQLGEEGFEFAKDWVGRFADIFGEPTRGSIYWSTTFFTACMYVAYQYKDKSNLDEKLREKLLGDAEILEFGKFGGREANRKMIGIIEENLRLTPNIIPQRGVVE